MIQISQNFLIVEKSIFCKLLGGITNNGRTMVFSKSCFWIVRFFLICIVLAKTRFRFGFVSHSTKTFFGSSWFVLRRGCLVYRLATKGDLQAIPKVQSVFHNSFSAIPLPLFVFGVYEGFLPFSPTFNK